MSGHYKYWGGKYIFHILGGYKIPQVVFFLKNSSYTIVVFNRISQAFKILKVVYTQAAKNLKYIMI